MASAKPNLGIQGVSRGRWPGRQTSLATPCSLSLSSLIFPFKTHQTTPLLGERSSTGGEGRKSLGHDEPTAVELTDRWRRDGAVDQHNVPGDLFNPVDWDSWNSWYWQSEFSPNSDGDYF